MMIEITKEEVVCVIDQIIDLDKTTPVIMEQDQNSMKILILIGQRQWIIQTNIEDGVPEMKGVGGEVEEQILEGTKGL
jgi:hypothetical protein